jgi:hypothetical protein
MKITKPNRPPSLSFIKTSRRFRVPQVQLIGNGTFHNHECLTTDTLKQPSHATIHKTPVTPADEAAGATRFYPSVTAGTSTPRSTTSPRPG